MHIITTVEENDTDVTRITKKCSCGWGTIGTVPEPDHHTPLAKRVNDHLAQVAAIEDGTVWDEIPDGHAYRLHLRRRPETGEPTQIVIIAVWVSGSREVLNWPCTPEGVSLAQGWCDTNPTTWSTTGYYVQRGSLAGAVR